MFTRHSRVIVAPPTTTSAHNAVTPSTKSSSQPDDNFEVTKQHKPRNRCHDPNSITLQPTPLPVHQAALCHVRVDWCRQGHDLFQDGHLHDTVGSTHAPGVDVTPQHADRCTSNKPMHGQLTAAGAAVNWMPNVLNTPRSDSRTMDMLTDSSLCCSKYCSAPMPAHRNAQCSRSAQGNTRRG